jgi:hypothetical protein
VNQYLIPANSKKSKLIFGFFTIPDLIACGIGGGLTIILLMVLKDPSTLELIIAILPLLTAAGLVFPIAHYHNVMQLLSNIMTYAFGVKKYYWKGWCVKDDTDE